MDKLHEIKIGKNQQEQTQFIRWLRKKGHKVQKSERRHNMVDGVCCSQSTRAKDILDNLFIQFCSRNPEPIIVQQLSVIELARKAAEDAGTEIEQSPFFYKNPTCTEYATKDGRTIRVLAPVTETNKQGE